jgi:nicotinamide mononucleotide (NMN) deamidase PncC
MNNPSVPIEKTIGDLLLARGLKLLVAESCTGGLIGHRLTNIPGSSEYYLGSITAYAYEVKESLLEKTRIIPPPSGGGYRRDGRSPYSSEQRCTN